MTSGLARLPFVLSPPLDERVCPFQECSVMLLNRKNQESPAHAAMKEDTKGAVRWFDFISQYPKVLSHFTRVQNSSYSERLYQLVMS
jgi:hypothetical protein